jgi:acyl-coenzyme A thioesterase PaaI-like protein
MTDLRRRVLTALALDRTPGFTYSGNFLGVRFPSITPDCVRVVMDEGAHSEDEHGQADIGAVSLLADVAMASVVRARLTPEQRLATVSLTLQFTGAPLVGALEGIGEFEAFIDGADSRQGLSRGVLTADGRPVLFGSGAFMVMNPPPGRAMHPIVDAVHADAAPLAEQALEAHERELLARAERALEAAGGARGFLRHFWGLVPVATPDGACCRTVNGAHIGNRVGHMQGGLQMGMAIVTAGAALPPGWAVSGISAWFMSPGEGDEIEANARVEHRGRNTAVVRTVITGVGGRRVLEAMTTHLRRN